MSNAWSDDIEYLPLLVRPLRPGAYHRVHRMDALFGETIGGEICRDALLGRDREDAQHGVVDLVGLAEGARRRPARELAVDVDHTAGVGDVVRRVENLAVLELLAMTLLEQLIVRG